MKCAIVQMQVSANLEANLSKMERFIQQAHHEKAKFVCFPEMAYFSSKKEEALAVSKRFSEFEKLFQIWAKKYQIYLIPGTLREPIEKEKYFNTLLCFDPQGKKIAHYRKIFRFKANLPHHQYDEGRLCEGGKNWVTTEILGLGMGFAICFDLRFPELFRSLKKAGAKVFVIPSAFTVPTGKAHWEVLLRARAIENQAYVIAPDQTGVSGEGLSQYGHSLVVDPWGEVVLSLGEEEAIQFFEVLPSVLKEAESKISAWESRNEALFPIA